ncbi:nad binding enzyme [Bacillus stratosphericus]|uniref:nad binding enzyme n=1 Tax=Bacillus stratosphericus TaxID=293386 RepID=UPI001CFB7451|nr:nad binding enzyme [Bacillus stratosphericus]
METGLIIGADEFFGLTLCEHMMKEGIQVDITCPHDQAEEQKMLLEERMMWLGRNDLVRFIDLEDSKETYDLIFIQSEEANKRQTDLKAKHGMYRLLFEELEKEPFKQNVPAIILPRMFGPWTLDHGRRTRNDHSFFVEDAAKDLLKWVSCSNQRQDMRHQLKVERQTDDKQAEKMIVDWKRQNSTFFDKKEE